MVQAFTTPTAALDYRIARAAGCFQPMPTPCTSGVRFLIYDASHLRSWVEAPTMREAWRAARAAVRLFAHCDGVEGPEHIYSTANRAGCIARGIFHAVPERVTS